MFLERVFQILTPVSPGAYDSGFVIINELDDSSVHSNWRTPMLNDTDMTISTQQLRTTTLNYTDKEPFFTGPLSQEI